MKRKTKSKYNNDDSYYYLVIEVKINGVYFSLLRISNYLLNSYAFSYISVYQYI